MPADPGKQTEHQVIPGRKQADQDGKNEGALDRVTIECGSLAPVPPFNEGTPAVPGMPNASTQPSVTPSVANTAPNNGPNAYPPAKLSSWRGTARQISTATEQT